MSSSSRIDRSVWLSVLVIAVVRLIHAAVAPVYGDESFHWVCSMHLDWSFEDHPAMCPLLIRIGTSVFGDTPLGLRVGMVVVSLLYLLVVAALAQRLHPGRNVALAAVWLAALTPFLYYTSVLSYSYATLFLGWTGCMWMALVAVEEDRTLPWVFSGAFLALAVYSQVSSLIVLPSIALWLLVVRPRLLLRPGPYLGVLTALLLCLPLLNWSSQHDWNPFAFQFLGRHEKSFEPGNLAAFLGAQLALASPVLGIYGFALGWRRLWEGLKGRVPAALLVGGSFLGLLGLFGFHALTHDKVLLHWAMPAWLLIVPDAAGRLLDATPRLRRWVYGVAAGQVLLIAAIHVTAGSGWTERVVDKWDLEMSRHTETAAAIEELLASREGWTAFSNHPRVACSIFFHSPAQRPVYLWESETTNNPAYPRLYPVSTEPGWSAVFVGRDLSRNDRNDLARAFRKVERYDGDADAIAPYELYLCQGFLGEQE